MTPIFIGRIKGGKLELNDPQRYAGYLISLEGQEVQAVVGRIKKQRSTPQNRYYWGVVIKLLCETTGYTDSEMHDALRMMFLRDMDKLIPTLYSTANLTTVEFEDYLSKVRTFASVSLNCYIPDPNEVEI